MHGFCPDVCTIYQAVVGGFAVIVVDPTENKGQVGHKLEGMK